MTNKYKRYNLRYIPNPANPFRTKAYIDLEGFDQVIYDRITEQQTDIMKNYGIDVRLPTLLIDLTNGWVFNRKTGEVAAIEIKEPAEAGS